jgi:PKD repeat protein
MTVFVLEKRSSVIAAQLVLATCLTACGGGGDESALAEDTASAASDTSGVMVVALAARPWTKLANEGESFTLGSGTAVRYGSGTAWVTKTVSGSAVCSNSFFGSDPSPMVKKRCEARVAATAATAASPTPTVAVNPTAGTPPVVSATSVPAPQATTSPSPLGASFVASRVSGVAPLAVHFDATATDVATKTYRYAIDLFRQVKYSFDFGDERGETWAVSGLSKNTQTGGPVAAHVFTTPGTYTVTLAATESSGAAPSTATVTINVQDPNVVYAGAKTVCVSKVSDFASCPAGASKLTAFPASFNGLRVLLHSGESFGDIGLQDGNAGVIVSSYGGGAKPSVASVGVGSWRPATANFATDITVMNLAVAGKMVQSIGSRVLFYRNTLMSTDPNNSGLYFGNVSYWAQNDPYRQVPTAAFQHAREIFIVENTITSTTSGAQYGIFGEGANLAIMGNTLGSFQFHNVRVTKAYRTIIAHNELRGVSSGGMHALKLHSGGLTAYDPSYAVSGDTWASKDIVIVNNKFGSSTDNNAWTVAICPQNDQVAEGLERVLVSNNTFVKGAGTVANLIFAGRSMTYRDNTTVGSAAFIEGVGHASALPADWNGPYFSN